ncbi:MAG: 16S rRNA (uracil(1498)-N(3))-methyltransferase [Desulfobacterales bacterium]|nr:16S rRNA (uracil(1498)-N(3))-methyltransferase [Desulfobacterales bacterium]
MRRFFLDSEIIHSDRPAITGPDVRHIRTVLRLKPGEEITLFDGEGSEYRARITGSTPRAITLSVLDRYPAILEPAVQITIGQAILKAKKMDRIVRQLTELGIFAFIPFIAERSVPRPKPGPLAEKKQRWEAIAREALKQCGRSRIPHLGPMVPFKEVVGSGRSYDLKIIFHNRQCGDKPRHCLDAAQGVRKVLALIGPEGGFTDEEVKFALDSGFAAICLGPRVLKSDTASVAAGAILQYVFGDWVEPKKILTTVRTPN